MKNNKGQALIEFIIVLPVFVLLITAMIDIFNIMQKTYTLENDLNTIVNFYNNGEEDKINNYINANKLTIDYEESTDTTNIILNKNIRIVTPGLNIVLGNPYTITVNRVIYTEEK